MKGLKDTFAHIQPEESLLARHQTRWPQFFGGDTERIATAIAATASTAEGATAAGATTGTATVAADRRTRRSAATEKVLLRRSG